MSKAAIGHAGKLLDSARRAFSEFLLVPACIIAGFLVLAACTFMLDRGSAGSLMPIRDWLQAHVFADASATGELLGIVSAGLITLTSITISLLLIALQQSAGALTHQVYDQFLRTWHNQVYFGVFIGLALYSLIMRASVGPLNPVFGGSIALVLTIAALGLVLVLFYTTVNQMRPVVIVEAIHRHVLAARVCQLELIRKTRRASELVASHVVPVTAQAHGFVTAIDVEAIRRAASRAGAGVEVGLRVTIGSYVVFGQVLADVKAQSPADATAVAGVVEEAIHREEKRDIASDPLYGVEELETIGWTSISTAQSDPDAGVLTIFALRDILARWVQSVDQAPEVEVEVAPVVYQDDVLLRLLNSFESLAVSASESMQHQSLAEILRTFELLFDRLPPEMQARAEDLILRALSGLGDHVLTRELETGIAGLIAVLENAGRRQTAGAARAATDSLARSIGRIGSRSTRVEPSTRSPA